MQNIQYYHLRSDSYSSNDTCFGGETFCVETPDTKSLLGFLGDYLANRKCEAILNIGYCKCHPTDRFIKKEGQRISLERLTSTPVKVVRIHIEGDFIYFTFSVERHEINLRAYIPKIDAPSHLICVREEFNAGNDY